jgi:hypothetical protein
VQAVARELVSPNVVATIVLLLYMQTLSHLADLAAETTSSPANDLAQLRSSSPALHAGAAVLLLLLATVLAMYKPRGLTPYGWRKQNERRALTPPGSNGI